MSVLDRKAPSSENNFNADFCSALIELANWEKNVNKAQHKSKAYRKAAQVLADLDHRVKDGEEAKKLPGVGQKIAKKIDEIISTGKLVKLENIRQDDSSVAINLLTRVSGIGPTKARELYEEGILSIEDLKKNLDKLNPAQKVGVKHFVDFEKRIPRSEIKQIEAKIREIVSNLDSRYNLTVCGSYRRGALSSGDVDVLLTHTSLVEGGGGGCKKGEGGNLLSRVVRSLQEVGLVTDTLSLGETKFMGVCRLSGGLARRLDIRLLPSDQFYCGILYFTGSDVFNQGMRAWALERGFTLNEYSLRPTLGLGRVGGLEPLPVSSERDIFDYLEFKYKPPRDR